MKCLAAEPDRIAVDHWAMQNFAVLEPVTADELHKIPANEVLVVSRIAVLSAGDFAMLVRNGVLVVSAWTVDGRPWTGTGGIIAPVVGEFAQAAERWAKEAPPSKEGQDAATLERRLDQMTAQLIEAQMTIQELRCGVAAGSLGGEVKVSGASVLDHGADGGASCKVDPPSVTVDIRPTEAPTFHNAGSTAGGQSPSGGGRTVRRKAAAVAG